MEELLKNVPKIGVYEPEEVDDKYANIRSDNGDYFVPEED